MICLVGIVTRENTGWRLIRHILDRESVGVFGSGRIEYLNDPLPNRIIGFPSVICSGDYERRQNRLLKTDAVLHN